MTRMLTPVLAVTLLSPVATAQSTIPWRGGPVIENARIIAVYWGTPTPEFKASMDRFYEQLVGTTYLAGLAEYSTGPVTRPALLTPFRQWFASPQRQRLGSAVFAGSYDVKPGTTGTAGTTDVGPELDYQIRIGRLPPPDRGTIYMVHFSPAWKVYMGTNILGIPIGSWAGDGFCGYHAAYYSSFTSRAMTFAVLPSQDVLPRCDSQKPLDAETEIASHELVEAITDPGSAVHFGAFLSTGISSVDQAWARPRGTLGLDPDEVADRCGWAKLRMSPQDSYRVSEIWRNSFSSCSLAPPVGVLDGPWRDGKGAVRLHGWAVDPKFESSSIEVHLYFDGPYPWGRGIAVRANLARPDVNSATGFPGAHGFDLAVPDEYLDGRPHTVYAYGIGITQGNNMLLANSAATFNSLSVDPASAQPVMIVSEQELSQCLDLVGYGRVAGTPLQMYQCHGGENQRFWYDAGSQALAVYNDRSLCLDAAGGAGNDGDSVIAWQCHGEANQQWTFDPIAGEIRGVNGKCLDARGATVENGAGLQLWTCHGGANQRWFRR